MQFTHALKIVLGFTLPVFIPIYIFGCSTTKGKETIFSLSEPKPGKAIIYHYRVPRALYGVAASYDVLCNNVPVARIGDGGYFKQQITPGQIEIRTRNVVRYRYNLAPSGTKEFMTQFDEAYTFFAYNGRTYFLRYTVDLEHELPIIEQVSKKVALKEMEGLRSFLTILETENEEKRVEKIWSDVEF